MANDDDRMTLTCITQGLESVWKFYFDLLRKMK